MRVEKPLLDSTVGYRGLREWLQHSEEFGELLKIDGAHWDTEMGAITHMMTEKSRGQAPAILFVRPRASPLVRSSSVIPVIRAMRCISQPIARAAPMPASGPSWSTKTSMRAISTRCCER